MPSMINKMCFTTSTANPTTSTMRKTISAAVTTNTSVMRIAFWLLPFMLLMTLTQQPCECRYLPTRSHGDDLDKLRELMLQILESSNEEQRPPNEANGNALAQRAAWLNKIGALDAMDAAVPRKYGANLQRGIYENGRYY